MKFTAGLLIGFLFATFLTFATLANAADVTLAWEYDTESQSGITGFQIFAVPVIANYDYEIPAAMVDNNTLSVTFDVQSNVELKFVVRAYLDTGETIYTSPDSNEIQHAFVLAPGNLAVQ